MLVTGAGSAFSAGGDLAMVESTMGNADAVARTMREAGDIVYNMLALEKPMVSAINGVAVGAGLVVALLADVSIIAETARLTDGHTRLGVVAGDHSAIIWPLLCGMAKAKYYLFTCDFVSGPEAERIGLVSLCVPPGELMAKAVKWPALAQGSQPSIRWTKRALNNWLRWRVHLRPVSCARDAHLHGRRRARGRTIAPGEAAPTLPLRALSPSRDMEHRPLGATGLDVAVIGMGTWRTFDVRGAAVRSSRRDDTAIAAGANFFDTSPMYGAAERVLAETLGQRGARHIVAHESVGDSAGARAALRSTVPSAGTAAGWTCTRSTTSRPGRRICRTSKS